MCTYKHTNIFQYTLTSKSKLNINDLSILFNELNISD